MAVQYGALVENPESSVPVMFCDPQNLQIMFQSKPLHDNSTPTDPAGHIPCSSIKFGSHVDGRTRGESMWMAGLCQAVAFILSPVSAFDVVVDRCGPFLLLRWR